MKAAKSMGIVAALAVAVLLMIAAGKSSVRAASDHKMAPLPAATAGLERATFAMGCFWSAESAFEGLPGVQAVTSGYTGGKMKNPTYADVGSGATGHAEAIQVLFDPKRITYARLLDVFWHNIDPTMANGQFTDMGTEYRTAIFHHDESQRRLAEASKHQLETTPQRFQGPIVTEIVPAGAFYPAEIYHQDYARKNPVHYTGYRVGSGHDARLIALWGKPGRHGD